MAPRPLLTVAEAAELLKLHPQTLRRWIHQGKLSARRIGRQFRLPAHELETILRPTQIDADEMLPMERAALAGFGDLWDNKEDAIYDDWKRLYGVKSR
jgi:excisionase family DNA binding protein